MTLAMGPRLSLIHILQSTAQIAAELGLSPRAVEGRLYRLKKRLAKALGGVHNG